MAPGPKETTQDWHARSVDEVLDALEVRVDHGLSTDEAERRLEEFGRNQLRKAETRPWWRILLAQFQTIVVYLLVAAAILAFVTQRWAEGLAVVAVIAVNTALGFVSEWKAIRSMAALRKMGEAAARVRRDGEEREIEAPEVVPGDIVLVDAGDLAPADLRLVEADHLRINEAPLTGESVPADKTTQAVEADAPLGDRVDMLYKGTSVADGSAVGVVVATGAQTEIGNIAKLAEEAESTATPLQKRLDSLGRRLAWLTVGIAAVVAGVGILVREQETALVVETAIALGIAAIPEGLPIVATIALARGMWLMAKRNALVNRLAAVETLGSTRVIFTDKTGTLTENRMDFRKLVTPSGAVQLDDEANPDELGCRLLEVAVLCNAASLDVEQGEGTTRGDPTEVALLEGAQRVGLERGELIEEKPEVRVEEFDPDTKMMATFHEADGEHHVAVKGAPQAVLDACSRVVTEDGERDLDDRARDEWLKRADALASEGLRVLAIAEKEEGSAEEAAPYENLRLLGLVGLLDPPKKGVKESIDRCQAAGIRVEMVTGDKPETAVAIAEAVGIVGEEDDPETVVMRGSDLDAVDGIDDQRRDEIYRANIFARVSPEQKLNLVKVYQDHGEVVAMTGDGVNDAPALKKADIGIAMGQRGTDAARQVSDMVLEDDSFETIAAAVEQGRVIFANIRKSVIFMLCTNVAEVLAVTVATLVGWTLPLLPLQILYLNVLTDVFPAMALGVGPGSGNEMKRPPRDPQEAVLTRAHWTEIIGWASLIAACVLTGLLAGQYWLGFGEAEAITVSFLTLAFGKLWFTFNLRDAESGIFRNEVTRNRWVWGAVALCIVLLLAAVYLPGLNDLLRTSTLDWRGWALVLGLSVVPLLVGQGVREVQRSRGEPERHREQQAPAAAAG